MRNGSDLVCGSRMASPWRLPESTVDAPPPHHYGRGTRRSTIPTSPSPGRPARAGRRGTPAAPASSAHAGGDGPRRRAVQALLDPAPDLDQAQPRGAQLQLRDLEVGQPVPPGGSHLRQRCMSTLVAAGTSPWRVPAQASNDPARHRHARCGGERRGGSRRFPDRGGRGGYCARGAARLCWSHSAIRRAPVMWGGWQRW